MARQQRVRIEKGRVKYALEGDALDMQVAASCAFGAPENAEVFEPRGTSIVPESGAWALITRALPPIEAGLDKIARVGCAFWVWHLSNADEAGFLPDGRYKVEAVLPGPAVVCLWPYEYRIVPAEMLTEMWTAGLMTFTAAAVTTTETTDRMFFAMARGIPRHEALVMALGTVAGPVGHFEPSPEFAAEAEHLGQLGRGLSPINHARRAAARKARIR